MCILCHGEMICKFFSVTSEHKCLSEEASEVCLVSLHPSAEGINEWCRIIENPPPTRTWSYT